MWDDDVEQELRLSPIRTIIPTRPAASTTSPTRSTAREGNPARAADIFLENGRPYRDRPAQATRSRQTFFLYVYEPGGKPRRSRLMPALASSLRQTGKPNHLDGRKKSVEKGQGVGN